MWWTPLILLFFTVSTDAAYIVSLDDGEFTLMSGLCEEGICNEENGGRCKDVVYGYINSHVCMCPPSWSGQSCHVPTGVSPLTTRPSPFTAVLHQTDVSMTQNHKYVSTSSNHTHAILQDLATASLYPLHVCLNATLCASVYKDGNCDPECESEACLFDGFDCEKKEECASRSICKQRFGDGFCDPKCDNEECGWDGGDCLATAVTNRPYERELSGRLVINSRLSPFTFLRLSHELLFELSTRIRATVTLARDEKGLIVYEWKEKEGRGARLRMEEEEHWLKNQECGVEIHLQVDVSTCSRSCFSTLSSVAAAVNEDILKRVTVHGKNTTAGKGGALAAVLFASALYADQPQNPEDVEENLQGRTLFSLLAAGALFLLTLILFVAHIIVRNWKQPKVSYKCAPVWIPPFQGEKTPRVESSQETEQVVEERRGSVLHHVLANATQTGESLRRLIDELVMGTDINSPDQSCLARSVVVDVISIFSEGLRPIQVAIKAFRSPSLIFYLIEKGANPLEKDGIGRNALHHAVECGDHILLEKLLQIDSVRVAVNETDDRNRTPLVSAIMTQCKACTARILINAGADVNYEGDIIYNSGEPYDDCSPLHHAVAVRSEDHIRLLVEFGAIVDAKDAYGKTPLFHAAERCDLEMCILLVEFGGADLSAADKNGHCPEDVARCVGVEAVASYLMKARQQRTTSPPSAPLRRKRKAVKAENEDNKYRRISSDAGYGSTEASMLTTEESLDASSGKDISDREVRAATIFTPLTPRIENQTRILESIPEHLLQPLTVITSFPEYDDWIQSQPGIPEAPQLVPLYPTRHSSTAEQFDRQSPAPPPGCACCQMMPPPWPEAAVAVGGQTTPFRYHQNVELQGNVHQLPEMNTTPQDPRKILSSYESMCYRNPLMGYADENYSQSFHH